MVNMSRQNSIINVGQVLYLKFLVNVVQDGGGIGSRYMIYWSYPQHGDPMKLTLTVYDKDILQVEGWSFFLWVLDCLPKIRTLVESCRLQQIQPLELGILIETELKSSAPISTFNHCKKP